MMFAKQTANPTGQSRKSESSADAALAQWEIESADAFDFMRIGTATHESGMDRVITVTSVNAVARRFLAGGGTIVRPKITIPGIGKLISCKDTVGQVFTFLEEECPVFPQRVHFN